VNAPDRPSFILLGVLVVLALFFIWRWLDKERPGILDVLTGFVTNFFDTLGIGSFATTTAIFKFRHRMPDEQIPGTLNIGHALPTVVQALIYISIIQVQFATLVSMIGAAVLGAWLGAGVVSRLPRRAIQIGMGVALLVAAMLFAMRNLDVKPGPGEAHALSGGLLLVGVGVNFVLGALMTLGIGLYAPCLILVSMLGMNPDAAFPIMMGSCAFLMPPAGLRFIARGRYNLKASLGLALGGALAVPLAASLVFKLPITHLRWLVIFVVVFAAVMMLRSAVLESRRASAQVPEQV